jgi:transposase
MAVKKLRAADTPLVLNSGYLETLDRLNQQANGNALLRIWQIVGDKKRGIPALLPIGRNSFYRGIKEGRYTGRKATAKAQAGKVIELIQQGLTKQAVADTLNIGVASVYRIARDAKAA